MPAGALTRAEWEQLGDEDDLLRHEIIYGVHYTQRGATPRHQFVLGELLMALHAYAKPRGDLLLPVVGTVLSEHDAVVPDLIYATRERRANILKTYVEGAPDLIAEIVLDETRETDTSVKRRLYERVRVQEYWVVDPDAETVTLHRHNGTALVRVADLGKSRILTTPLLPGFALDVGEIFAV